MGKDWLKKTSFAHRGLHGPETGFIENSQSAFIAATENGHGFELDVLLSKDHKAIVFHDATLERLTETSGKLLNLTSDEISRINFRDKEEAIPSLSSILQNNIEQSPILIEIKGDQGLYIEIADAVWTDINKYSGPCAIMSFYPPIVNHFKENYPEVTRGFVATPINDGSMPDDYFSTEFQIEQIQELDVDFIAYDIKSIPNEVIRYCKGNNIPILTWTVRSAEQHTTAQEHTDNIIFEL